MSLRIIMAYRHRFQEVLTGFLLVAGLAVKAARVVVRTLNLAAVNATAIAVAVELARAAGPLKSLEGKS